MRLVILVSFSSVKFRQRPLRENGRPEIRKDHNFRLEPEMLSEYEEIKLIIKVSNESLKV